MDFSGIRETLRVFYQTDSNKSRAKALADKCFARLDELYDSSLNLTELKLMQYDVILDELDLIVFPNLPFYYETGALTSHSDGCRNSKEGGFIQAAGWLYFKNHHLFKEKNPTLWDLLHRQRSECLYLIGDYGDTGQHFNFNNRPVLYEGLSGIYNKAQTSLENASKPEEVEFLQGICSAMFRLKKLAEMFSQKAETLMQTSKNEEERRNLSLIADTAKRVPWEAPRTLYEALNTLAFMRKAIGTLEGIGPNTFGRLDVDLYPFYKADIEEGRLTESEAYDLICKFLIIWDCHYDHDMKMVMYADHELENTYVLGGCDTEGNPVWNELTRMFLRATREEKIIFPKIKCRYGTNSPREYLDEINRSIIDSTSTVLFQNDDATIPAIVRSGRPIEEARDYLVTGCWGMASYTEKFEHGSYFNILKAFEIPLHLQYSVMDKIELQFKVFDGCASFEEIYERLLYNINLVLQARIRITREGGMIWNDVDTYPIFSSTILDCIENKKDFRSGGARYRDDYLLCFGLPNIVDSLMAIKTLCFEEKKYTLSQMLEAVRSNWEGFDNIRADALKCHGWGDGNEDSSQLASRLNNDIYELAASTQGSYGGRVHIGHLTYTEIRWWGEKTLATPDGRYSGDYFSQGLTPSRLKKISSVTDVVNSLKYLDSSTMASNNVVNIILPSTRVNLDVCAAFLKSVAGTSCMSLQLNCVTKEQLLDAQKHPEKYPDLIVRVCGFSARFTALSPEWQNEVLTRNFYD